MKKFSLPLVAVFWVALSLLTIDKAEAYYTSYQACQTYTVCPQGFTISCSVWADVNTATACSWYVVPYTSVSCNGLNAWGQWVSLYYSCY